MLLWYLRHLPRHSVSGDTACWPHAVVLVAHAAVGIVTGIRCRITTSWLIGV